MAEHQQLKKHKKGLTANAATSSVTTFFKKTEPSQKDYELAVQESILAYRTIKHSPSHRSIDCTAPLTKKHHEPNFSCSQTKGEAMDNNMFAPWATNMMTQDLDQVESVSLSVDSSSHGHGQATANNGQILQSK